MKIFIKILILIMYFLVLPYVTFKYTGKEEAIIGVMLIAVLLGLFLNCIYIVYKKNKLTSSINA